MSENRFFWLPKALLPLKGRLDARKGPAAASAYVDKTRQRLAVLTALETMEVEKALQRTRQDASGRLAERNRTLERLVALPPRPGGGQRRRHPRQPSGRGGAQLPAGSTGQLRGGDPRGQ